MGVDLDAVFDIFRTTQDVIPTLSLPKGRDLHFNPSRELQVQVPLDQLGAGSRAEKGGPRNDNAGAISGNRRESTPDVKTR